MKKALTTLSVAFTSLATTLAQGTGGTITIGNTATQGQINGGALLSLLALAQTIVTRLVPFAIGVAVLSFFWFLISFIWKGKESPEQQQKDLKGIGLSIVALFVMVSIWGIVGLLGSMLGVGQGGNVPIPGVPIPG